MTQQTTEVQRQKQIDNLARQARGVARTAVGNVRRVKMNAAFTIGKCVAEALAISLETRDFSLFNYFSHKVGMGFGPHHMRYCFRFYTLTHDNDLLSKLKARGVSFSRLYPALETDVPDNKAVSVLTAVANRTLNTREITPTLSPYVASAKQRAKMVNVSFKCPKRIHHMIRDLAYSNELPRYQVIEVLLQHVLRNDAEQIITRARHNDPAQA